MRICDNHWAELKAKIAERGMESLCAKEGSEVAAKMRAELDEGASAATFDPLMAAHNAIVGNALRSPAGFEVMQNNPDGTERCPICYIADIAPAGTPIKSDIVNWTTYAAEAALAEARRLGLVGVS